MKLTPRTKLRSAILVLMAAIVALMAVFVAAAAGSGSRSSRSGFMPAEAGAPATAAPDPLQPETSPFRITGPGGQQNLARAPGVEDGPRITDVATIRMQIPQAGFLAAPDELRFKRTAVIGRTNANGFLSIAYYVDELRRQVVSVGSWTKVGDFSLIVTPGSPVVDSKLTSIDGLPALTLLPSSRVVGGLAPRQVFLYRAGVIFSIYAEGMSSDDEFMAIVRNFISEVVK